LQIHLLVDPVSLKAFQLVSRQILAHLNVRNIVKKGHQRGTLQAIFMGDAVIRLVYNENI